MSAHDRLDADGIRHDGVRYDPGAAHLPIYAYDRQHLVSFQEPVLLHANNPSERLFVAAFDGTGNDISHDPGHATNVGRIAKQIEANNNPQIASGYVAGPGTQQRDPITRLLDGAMGYTVDERAEQMYKMYIQQAWKWKQQDPHAQIRVASIGFSRGGEEAALFARLVDERGIQDPSGAIYTYDAQHQIKHVEYTKAPLEPPHQVAQAVVLFDPVGTGHAMHEDRRLPPSVISGIQFTALDEQRGSFKSDRIIDPGITPDGRFAGLDVPGAHSDVGGGYHRDGLSIRTGNFAIDYLNGLSDQPFLGKTTEPDDPRLNVIHRSEEGNLLFRLAPKIDRRQPGGYNELLVPKSRIGQVADAANAEARDESLSRQFGWQAMPNGPLPGVLDQQRVLAQRFENPKSELEQWIDRMYQASQNPDSGVWDKAQHAAALDYLGSPHGQQFQLQANQLREGWDMQQQATLQVQRREQAAQQAMQQTPPGSQGFSQ